IAAWMHEAGMHTWTDNVANVHGRIRGQNVTAPALVIGSHYDTVKDAGKFDGALGILAGIAAVKALVIQTAIKSEILTYEQAESIAAGAASVLQLLNRADVDALVSSPVEVVAFCDEEGLSFQTTLLGSRALAGSLLAPTNLLNSRNSEGLSVKQVLQQHGYNPAEDVVSNIALTADQVRAYIEVHLEQGPVLEAAGKPLGVVSAIAAPHSWSNARSAVTPHGSFERQASSYQASRCLSPQGHAGTVPMAIRRDPLAAAAEAINMIEQQCAGGQLAGMMQSMPNVKQAARSVWDPSLVCTVGALSVWPGASNVIAGATNFSVDIRQAHGPPQKPNGQPSSQLDETPVLVSGAGHDGLAMADLTQLGIACAYCIAAVQIGMLFVRCRGGISHSPQEYVSDEDVGRATTALYTFLAALLQ
ncbi:MAG: allantoate chloroplastic-like, partial [Trebouxia sp. A1-2]